MRRKRVRNEFDDSDDNDSGVTTSVPETPDEFLRQESRQASVVPAASGRPKTGAAAESEALKSLEKLFDDAEYRDLLSRAPARASEKRAELKRLKKLRAEKVVEYEADLRDRFAGEETDHFLSPTKKMRLMADVRRAAERRARKDEEAEEHVRDLHVFDTRRRRAKTMGAVNAYDKVLKESDRSDGWYMFMRDEDMRRWFFASSMYERFKNKTFPDWNDACALWVQEELCLEKNDALREKYADVWVSVVARSIKKQPSDNDGATALWERCEALLKSVGLKTTCSESPQTWVKECSHDVAYISDDLLHQSLKPADTVIRCVTKACCRFLQYSKTDEQNLVIAQKVLETLLLICGSDCMIGNIGLTCIGDGVAAIVESLADTVWAAAMSKLSKAAFALYKHSKSARLDSIPMRMLSNLDQAVVAASSAGGRLRIERLHQQLAISFWLEEPHISEDNIETVLETKIIPRIEKKALYNLLANGSRQAAIEMIETNADALKRDCLLLTHAIRGLPYLNTLSSNSTEEAHITDARRKLAAWIQRQHALVQLADPGRDKPHLYGYAIALQSAEAVVSVNFVRTLTGIF